jgi:hypothetical protein
MLNLGDLVSTVQCNCHISDAKYAGDLTLCVFLMKMREFYRWENQLGYRDDLPKEAIGDWMLERERLWEDIEAAPFRPIPLASGIDPFDSAAVNRELIPHGYVYSGGYGRFRKPMFFLAELERVEQRAGFNVYVSDCEYARDLEAPPAMMLDGDIYVRRESVRRFLWEKIEEAHFGDRNEALARALACYPFDADPDAALAAMAEHETEAMVLHELGEGLAGEHLGPAWRDMMGDILRTRAELMARGARDLFADCVSTLPGLIERRDEASLHFFFANFRGMRRHLAPELMLAYRRWVGGDRLNKLDRLDRLGDAVSAGRERWRAACEALLAIHAEAGDKAAEAIVAKLEPAA